MDYATLFDDSIGFEENKAYTSMAYISGGGIKHQTSGKVTNSMYTTRSGLIVFTSLKSGTPVIQKALPQPNSAT